MAIPFTALAVTALLPPLNVPAVSARVTGEVSVATICEEESTTSTAIEGKVEPASAPAGGWAKIRAAACRKA